MSDLWMHGTRVLDEITVHWVPEAGRWAADCHHCWIAVAWGDDPDTVGRQALQHLPLCADRP